MVVNGWSVTCANTKSHDYWKLAEMVIVVSSGWSGHHEEHLTMMTWRKVCWGSWAALFIQLSVCSGKPSLAEDDDSVIKLGVILPQQNDLPWSLRQTMPAIQYAVDNISNRTDLLQGYTVKVHQGDSQCSDTYGPLVAIDMYLRRLAHVFIGPACDYAVAPVARFSPHWNIPVLTGGALVQAFHNKRSYSQLTRMTGSYSKLGQFFWELLREFNWAVTGLIYHGNSGDSQAGKSKCYFVMEAIYLNLQNHYKSMGIDREVWYKSFNENSPPNSYNMTNILKEASLHSRRKHSIVRLIHLSTIVKCVNTAVLGV